MHRHLKIYIKSHIYKKKYKESLQNTDDYLELKNKPLELFLIAENTMQTTFNILGAFVAT